MRGGSFSLTLARAEHFPSLAPCRRNSIPNFSGNPLSELAARNADEKEADGSDTPRGASGALGADIESILPDNTDWTMK